MVFVLFAIVNDFMCLIILFVLFKVQYVQKRKAKSILFADECGGGPVVVVACEFAHC